jgi:hypothetical protein
LSAPADMPISRTCGVGMLKTSWFAFATDQSTSRTLWIGGARDRQGNDDPSGPVVAHKVGDNACDEARIRYDDLSVVESLDFGRANIDAAHEALIAANHDPVADPYGASQRRNY